VRSQDVSFVLSVQRGATDFDLVKIHHPDKVDQSVPSGVAHARFQAITSAYNALRTNSASAPGLDKADPPTPAARAMYKRSRNLYSGPQLADDSWKDRIIVAGVIFVRVFISEHFWRALTETTQAAFCFVIQAAAARRAFLDDAITRPGNTAPNSKGRPSNTAPSVDPRLAEPDTS
jgi:curved DNA-binding protein CbpA